ncbi:MAG: lipid-A-disaccharide synthase [Myxococcota bacterium]
MSRIFLSAGDASGELHAAAFVDALRARIPDARFQGLGGVAMEKAGVELCVHQRELAIGGFVEVVSSARRLWRAWRTVTQALARVRPDLLVLVDSPDFNLPLARRGRRLHIPILYYVSPQVWAWRRGRIRKIARRVDRLAVIFPFEPQEYRGSGLRVDYVGHPLVERMEALRERLDRVGARRALGLDPGARWMALLPGSRRNEIRHGLGLQLECARAVHAERPEVRFAIALAPSLSRESVDEVIARARLPEGLELRLIEGRTHELLLAADVALAKPGTVTVEVTLLGCPFVVAARAHPLSAAIGRRVIAVPSLTMANLIAGAPVVPEFLQEQARPERVARALLALLEGPARELQQERLARVRESLGAGGAAERAAAIAAEMLDEGIRA